ncbi:MAG: hypothetical protein IT373_07695 [Polyangiaceae bacterium]|nr:hypothetical protein [Polyangiaceae bacterium]
MLPERKPAIRPVWTLGAVVAAAGALLPPACVPEPTGQSSVVCPNEFPALGSACATPGLVCSYSHPAGCPGHFPATCGADGTWSFEDDCVPSGGSGGTGGAGATGGTGGAGGVPCTDPVAGPPTVTSLVAVEYPPDGHVYELTFSEPVAPPGPGLSWVGTGSIASVKLTGPTSYAVEFTGMTPGTHSTLTVGTGVEDTCGAPLAAPVDVDIALLPRCHLLGEYFEGDLAAAGFSVSDAAGTGNLWQRSDLLAGGVPNHTDGAGLCASVGDHLAPATLAWGTALTAPALDLGAESHVVLRYESAFASGTGATARLEASADGTSWSPLRTHTVDHGPVGETVDVSSYAGGELRLRFRYDDPTGSGNYWDVDELCVESFTAEPCPCTAGAYTEAADSPGVSDGNGTFNTGEDTAKLLSVANDRVAVCGELEDATESGADYYRFALGGVAGTDKYLVKLTYCLENSFQDATLALRMKTKPLPLALLDTAHGKGELTAVLDGGAQYYIALEPGAATYDGAKYAVSVTVQKKLGPILAEGFEVWPPLHLTVSDDDLCLDWTQSYETVQPPGGLPTEGFYLAMFNSYDCSSGSESLTTPTLSMTGKSSVSIAFDLYHDPAYPTSLDSIQVQYDSGSGWIDVGPAFTRPAAVAGWTTEAVDLSVVAGKPAVKIRLLATSEYGTDLHIDNVLLLGG